MECRVAGVARTGSRRREGMAARAVVDVSSFGITRGWVELEEKAVCEVCIMVPVIIGVVPVIIGVADIDISECAFVRSYSSTSSTLWAIPILSYNGCKTFIATVSTSPARMSAMASDDRVMERRLESSRAMRCQLFWGEG